MYPEPDATGGGAAAEEVTETATDATPEVGEQQEVKSTGNDFLDALNGVDDEASEQQENTEQTEQDYDLGNISELGLDAEEAEILKAAGRESGASPQQAIKLVTAIRDSIAERSAKLQEAAAKALQKDWGADYKRNITETATFIKRVGSASGWDKQEIEAYCTPQGFRMFNAVMRYVNGGKSPVSAQSSLVNAEPAMDKDALRKEAMRVAQHFFIARSNGDITKAKDLREQHYQLRKKLDGKNATYQLFI